MQMNANASIDAWIVTGMAPLTLLAAALLLMSVLAAAAEAVAVRYAGRGPWTWSPAPMALRRLALAVCGASLVVGTPMTAQATPGHGPEPRPRSGCAAECTGLDGLRLPDLPVSRPRGDSEARPPASSVVLDLEPTVLRPTSIVVRRGDCLWSLATDLVGRGARASDVAAAVDALYRTNRQRIGPDPDRVLAGTTLTIPEALR
jgi:nucleoid-associated protein YgaU